MKKPFFMVALLILIGLNAYASGNSHKQKNALTPQTTATMPIVGRTEHSTAHQANETTAQAALHTAGDSIDAEPQEDHTVGETVHQEDGHAATEHMAGDHGVSAEAAAVQNPIPVNSESISRGAAIFSQSCTVCHGNTGEGDGPGTVGFDPKPADLHADHVQGNSDGTMFWIISHGREGTAMPAWDTMLSEEQRWDVVNFLRTFAEGS